MAIPTINSTEGLATPAPFEARPTHLGQALGNLADNLWQSANIVSAAESKKKQFQKERRQQDDARWAHDTAFNSLNELTTWQADANNNSSETFGPDLLKYATERIEAMRENAPTPEAFDRYKMMMQSHVTSAYHGALTVGERNRLNNSRDSIISNIQFALGAYRNAENAPGANADQLLLQSRDDIHDGITSLFSSTPETASRLREYADTQFALALANTSPKSAKRFVEQSPFLDESDKLTLGNRISAMERVHSVMDMKALNDARTNLLSLAQAGKSFGTLPLNMYEVAMDTEHAQVAKAEDDEKITVLHEANTTFDKFAGKNPGTQNVELEKLWKKVSNNNAAHDIAVFQVARERLLATQELAAKDPVSYLTQYNTAVRGLTDQLSQATDEQTKKQLFAQRAHMIYDYQGYGTDEHLNMPPGTRMVMTRDEARNNAIDINKATPDQVVDKIRSLTSIYPQDLQSVAFGNIRDVGKDGIQQSYQVLWQNRDQWYLPHLVNAIRNAGDVGKLSEDRRKDLDNMVERDPRWKMFQQSMVGNMMERAPEVAGFKEAVMAIANADHVANQTSMRDSVKKALDLAIYRSLGVTQVNSWPLFVPRDRQGKQPRTDEEITDIGRRLAIALEPHNFNVADIDQRIFEPLGLVADKGDRNKILGEFIQRNGRFVPTHDGESATLYVPGKDGFPAIVTDKQGRALEIPYDALPSFTYTQRAPIERGFVSTTGAEVIPGGMGTVTNKYAPRTSSSWKNAWGIFSKNDPATQSRTNWPAYWSKTGFTIDTNFKTTNEPPKDYPKVKAAK